MGPPSFRSRRPMNRGTRDLPDPQHLDPGLPAPVAGFYRAHDASGTRIEQVVSMREGELLSPLRKGYTWALMDKW
jgi:hypothetical protein